MAITRHTNYHSILNDIRKELFERYGSLGNDMFMSFMEYVYLGEKPTVKPMPKDTKN